MMGAPRFVAATLESSNCSNYVWRDALRKIAFSKNLLNRNRAGARASHIDTMMNGLSNTIIECNRGTHEREKWLQNWFRWRGKQPTEIDTQNSLRRSAHRPVCGSCTLTRSADCSACLTKQREKKKKTVIIISICVVCFA